MKISSSHAQLKCSTDNDFLGVYADCGKFLRCSNGIYYEMRCAPGTLFDFKRKICDHAQNVVCLQAFLKKKLILSSQPKSPSFIVNGHQYFVKKTNNNEAVLLKKIAPTNGISIAVNSMQISGSKLKVSAAQITDSSIVLTSVSASTTISTPKKNIGTYKILD